MTAFGHIALLGWVPFTLLLFAIFPPRRAVLTSTIIGWLFLPQSGYLIPGFVDYTKVTAISAALLLATCIFHPRYLTALRPAWLDLPMVAWVLVPIASSLANDLGFYDGISSSLTALFQWGIPYLIGRAYFRNLWEARDFAFALFYGGLVYLPLCLLEIRLSPQLHHWVYGFHQHSFGQTIRFGGYRPMVFMQHGLMLALWMAVASLAGFALYRSRSLKQVLGIPSGFLVCALIVTTVLCRSTAASGLLLMGLAVIWFSNRALPRLPYLALAAVPTLLLVVRIAIPSSTDLAVSLAADLVDLDRAQSVAFRFDNEDLLLAGAFDRPWFGWAGWDRLSNSLYGTDMRIVRDSAWIIVLERTGLLGLASFYGAFALIPAAAVSRFCRRNERHALPGPVAALAIGPLLFAIDSLLNYMAAPIYAITLGCLVTLYQSARRQASPGHLDAEIDEDLAPWERQTITEGNPQPPFTTRNTGRSLEHVYQTPRA